MEALKRTAYAALLGMGVALGLASPISSANAMPSVLGEPQSTSTDVAGLQKVNDGYYRYHRHWHHRHYWRGNYYPYWRHHYYWRHHWHRHWRHRYWRNHRWYY